MRKFTVGNRTHDIMFIKNLKINSDVWAGEVKLRGKKKAIKFTFI